MGGIFLVLTHSLCIRALSFPGLDRSYWKRFHKFRLEWEPGNPHTGNDGYVRWYVDGEFKFGIEGKNQWQ